MGGCQKKKKKKKTLHALPTHFSIASVAMSFTKLWFGMTRGGATKARSSGPAPSIATVDIPYDFMA